jgi:uncharacterized protein
MMIGLFLVCTAFLSVGMPREMTPVLEGNLPPAHPQVVEDAILRQHFGSYTHAVIGLECLPPESTFGAECISRTKDLQERIEASSILAPGASVHSLPGYQYIENVADQIVVGDLIGDTPLEPHEAQALREKVEGDPLLFGRILSLDRQASLIVFRLDGNATQNEVFDELEALASFFDDGETFRAGPYANHYQNRWFEIIAQREFALLGSIALIFVVTLMCVAIGWRGAICVGLAIGVSIVWSLGILGHLGVKQNVLTSSLPVVLLAIVSSHGYHVIEGMLRCYEASANVDEAADRALRMVAWPVLAAAATSTLGFLALSSVPIVALRDFGLFATVGIASGAVASVVLIPVVVTTFWPAVITAPPSTPRRWLRTRIGSFLKFASSIVTEGKPRKVVLAIAVVLVAGSSLGVSRIEINSKPPHFIPKGEKARDGFEILERRFQGTALTQLLIDCGPEGITDPYCLEDAKAVGLYAESLPDVVFATGLYERVARMHRELMNEGQAFDQIPEDRNAIEQLLMLDNESIVDELRDPERRFLLVNLFIYGFDSNRINAIRDSLWNYRNDEGLEGRMWVAGEFFLWAAMIDMLGEAWIESNVLFYGLLILLCLAVLRSVSLALLALVPVTTANWIVYGMMGWLGVTIDIANFAITLIVGAVAIDFYIHLITRMRLLVRRTGGVAPSVRSSINQVGIPIVFDCCSNLAFVALAASQFIPIRVLGMLLAVAMAASFLATLFLVPAIINSYPRLFFGREIARSSQRSGSSCPVPPGC